MKITVIVRIVAILLAGSTVSAAMADNAAASRVIAGVLVNLNHVASDEEKDALQAIAADDGVGRGFRAIAAAVSRLEHSAAEQDKEIMQRIIASERAAVEAKALAEIVLGFSHVPSDEVRTRLQAMQ